MRLNWLAYGYDDAVGYGKYSNRMVMALRKAGVSVTPELAGATHHPPWLLDERGMTWDCPTVSCMPPYNLTKLPKEATGEHWLLTMTEGGELPDEWADTINKAGVSRVIVPCEHNAKIFRDGGVACPVSVIAGGTDPDEFPLAGALPYEEPYTFVCLADRGNRKGFNEVYQAFYEAFGDIDAGVQDVRLIIKCRPNGNALIEAIVAHQSGLDPRIVYRIDDAANLRDLFAGADCFVCPSRSEGWGMPHREAAMMGLPVLTQAFSGLDDGYTRTWAMVVEKGRMIDIDDEGKHIKGQWRMADVPELAAKMRKLYERPWVGRGHGYYARQWLIANQTWDHAAEKLIALMIDCGLIDCGLRTMDCGPELTAIRAANRVYFAQMNAEGLVV